MLKRTIDMLAAAAGLVVLAPLFLIAAAAVKLTSPGPVFFRQARLARGGGTFRIFKFRTMVDGAERRGARVTGAGDVRVTAVGRFLRRHKLDELPQLINVLRGDMSLVGPRPEVPEFQACYPEAFVRLLSVRPGITHRTTQLFRNEEELLARSADPRAFYIEHILPRKLQLYLAGLDRATVWDDLRTIVDTVMNRSAAIELEFLGGGGEPSWAVRVAGRESPAAAQVAAQEAAAAPVSAAR